MLVSFRAGADGFISKIAWQSDAAPWRMGGIVAVSGLWKLCGLIAIVVAAVMIVLAVCLFVRWGKSSDKKTDTKNSNTKDSGGGGIKISEADYRTITERILQVDGKYKSVLFGAAGLKYLPITIPVNVAMQLAEAGKRVLLIDMDVERDAVAKAFEIEQNGESNLRPKPYRTGVENLQVWPGHNFAGPQEIEVNNLVEAAENNFDFVVVSASKIDYRQDRRQIVSAMQCGFTFTHNARFATRVGIMLKALDCKLIGNYLLAQ